MNLKKKYCDLTQNLNCDQIKKLKLWWNSKTQIVMKLKNSNCDKTQKLKLWRNLKPKLWWISNTQIVMKLKNSNCDEIQKLKMWWNSKTKMVTTQKLKLWQNSKTQMMTKLKKSKCDRTQRLSILMLVMAAKLHRLIGRTDQRQSLLSRIARLRRWQACLFGVVMQHGTEPSSLIRSSATYQP